MNKFKNSIYLLTIVLLVISILWFFLTHSITLDIQKVSLTEKANSLEDKPSLINFIASENQTNEPMTFVPCDPVYNSNTGEYYEQSNVRYTNESDTSSNDE